LVSWFCARGHLILLSIYFINLFDYRFVSLEDSLLKWKDDVLGSAKGKISFIVPGDSGYIDLHLLVNNNFGVEKLFTNSTLMWTSLTQWTDHGNIKLLSDFRVTDMQSTKYLDCFYKAGGTNFATNNVATCLIPACPGDVIDIALNNDEHQFPFYLLGATPSRQGETYMRLFDNGNEVRVGYTAIKHQVTSGACRDFVLHQGCTDDFDCGGLPSISVESSSIPSYVVGWKTNMAFSYGDNIHSSMLSFHDAYGFERIYSSADGRYGGSEVLNWWGTVAHATLRDNNWLVGNCSGQLKFYLTHSGEVGDFIVQGLTFVHRHDYPYFETTNHLSWSGDEPVVSSSVFTDTTISDAPKFMLNSWLELDRTQQSAEFFAVNTYKGHEKLNVSANSWYGTNTGMMTGVDLSVQWKQKLLFDSSLFTNAMIETFHAPSSVPTGQPSVLPSGEPTGEPSSQPTVNPSSEPTSRPSVIPSGTPSAPPTSIPSGFPSRQPSMTPSATPTGEPSSEPSGQPTGEPSSQPTDRPNTQPTSDPSAQPTSEPTALPSDVHPSGQPSGKPSEMPYPSAQPSMVPTGEPSNEPTSPPTGEPSTQPTSDPSTQPTGAPSYHPTAEQSITGVPISRPTSEPTALPSDVHLSGQPSGQPTSYPTYSTPLLLTHEEGSSTESVIWEVSQLGRHWNGDSNALDVLSDETAELHPLYLFVEIYPTSFPLVSIQYATVYVNDTVVVPFCTPGIECGSSFYVCAYDIDVSKFISSERGGSLKVEVTTTNVRSSTCDYNNYPLYVRMELHNTDKPVTAPPSLTPETESSYSDDEAELSFALEIGRLAALAGWMVFGACCGMLIWLFRRRAIAGRLKIVKFPS
jgi:hypothetical protein